MLHLCKDTYIQSDLLINNNRDRIVVSHEYGDDMPEGLQVLTYGTLLQNKLTLDELIGTDRPFANYHALFRYCFDRNNQDGRTVVIYLDQASLFRVLAAWHKILFANISASSSFFLLKAHLQRMSLFGPRTSREARVAFQDYLTKEQEYLGIFNSLSIDHSLSQDLIDDFRNDLSIEFLLSSYYYDGSNKENLKLSVKKIGNRMMEEQLKELLYLTYQNITNINFQQHLGLQTYSIDNLQTITDDPILQPLIKANLWRATTAHLFPRPTFDLSTFTDQEINALKSLVNQIVLFFYSADTTTECNLHNRYFYIDLLRDNIISDQDLNTILESEKNSNFETRLWATRDIDSVNHFFVDLVMQKVRSNSQQDLAPFKLR